MCGSEYECWTSSEWRSVLFFKYTSRKNRFAFLSILPPYCPFPRQYDILRHTVWLVHTRWRPACQVLMQSSISHKSSISECWIDTIGYVNSASRVICNCIIWTRLSLHEQGLIVEETNIATEPNFPINRLGAYASVNIVNAKGTDSNVNIHSIMLTSMVWDKQHA